MAAEVQQREGVWLDIVIPHLLCPKLEQCLRTLKKNTPACYRVILIDQSRNDYSHLQKEGLIDIIVKTRYNLGFSKAVNYGFRITDAPYVMALNDDVEFLSDTWLQDCMTVFDERADTACVNPSSPRNPHGGGGMVDQGPYHDALTEGNWTPEELHDIKVTFDGANTQPGREQIYPAGCTYATIFKRSALEALGAHEGSPYGIGLYDENFESGGSDYDLVRRLGLIGLRFYGTYRSWVYHWWLSTRGMMKEAGYGEDSYASTVKGYNSFRGKWGPTYGTGPNDSLAPEAADVYGKSGPKEPLNGQPFFTVLPL